MWNTALVKLPSVWYITSASGAVKGLLVPFSVILVKYFYLAVRRCYRSSLFMLEFIVGHSIPGKNAWKGEGILGIGSHV